MSNSQNCWPECKIKVFFGCLNFLDVINKDFFLPIRMRFTEGNGTPVLGHKGREGERDRDDPVGHGYNASPIDSKISFQHFHRYGVCRAGLTIRQTRQSA
jgi:hypothetical protein